jgi:hypothetical protein
METSACVTNVSLELTYKYAKRESAQASWVDLHKKKGKSKGMGTHLLNQV